MFPHLHAYAVKVCTIMGYDETVCEKTRLGVHTACMLALHLLGAESCCRPPCVGSTLKSQRGSLISPSDTQETSIWRETISPKFIQALAGF